jgi:hypothetical protein
MNSDQFNRALGTYPTSSFAKDYTHNLALSLRLDQDVSFDSTLAKSASRVINDSTDGNTDGGPWAHRAGVNSLVVDRFEGR